MTKVLKRQVKFRPGFTLIELLVVVAIAAIISGIFLANYHGGESQTTATAAAESLVRTLRLAQSQAMGETAAKGSFPPGGWGVHLNAASSTYILFPVLNSDNQYDPGSEGDPANGARIFNIPSNVAINFIIPTAATGTDIIFSSAKPLAYINYGAATSSAALITFQEAANFATSSVFVNETGLIYAQ